VVDDQVGSPTYTLDLAKAIRAMLKNTAAGYGTYHVSNSGSVSWYDYAKTVLRLAGSKTKVVPTSSKELARPAKRPAMSVLDNTKFRSYTGYKMRRWSAALKEYLNSQKGAICWMS
jgi:dTDP-4-dehydrorhamnose reductase